MVAGALPEGRHPSHNTSRTLWGRRETSSECRDGGGEAPLLKVVALDSVGAAVVQKGLWGPIKNHRFAGPHADGLISEGFSGIACIPLSRQAWGTPIVRRVARKPSPSGFAMFDWRGERRGLTAGMVPTGVRPRDDLGRDNLAGCFQATRPLK